MRKILHNQIISAVLLVLFTSIAQAQTHTILQLTDKATFGDVRYPQINDQNQVFWAGRAGSTYELFRYDVASSMTTQLTNTPYDVNEPKVNNRGDSVFKGKDYGIYFFDGNTGEIIQLSNSSYNYINAHPQINDKRQILWTGSQGIDWDLRKWGFIYNGTSVINLGENIAPFFGADGEVYWSFKNSIYHYNVATGVATQVIDLGPLTGHSPRNISVNANGVIVWSSQGVGTSDLEIFRYDKLTGVTQLSNDHPYYFLHNHSPIINTSGNVTWWRSDVGYHKIFLYESEPEIVKQLNYNDGIHYEPRINESSNIIWRGSVGSAHEIFFYNRATETVTQLTDTPDSMEWSHRINNNDHIIWNASNEVFLAAPCDNPCQAVSINAVCFSHISVVVVRGNNLSNVADTTATITDKNGTTANRLFLWDEDLIVARFNGGCPSEITVTNIFGSNTSAVQVR